MLPRLGLYLRLCLTAAPSKECVVGAGGDGLIAGEPVNDADQIAIDIAGQDDRGGGRVLFRW